MEYLFNVSFDLNTLIAVLVGGLCTIGGSYIAVNRQIKANEENLKTQHDYNTSNQRWELKYSILSDLTGNRRCIVEVNREGRQMASDSVKFFVALNAINVAYYDSQEVLEAYNDFHSITLNRVGDANEALYRLVKEMHKDLGIESPDRTLFLTPMGV